MLPSLRWTRTARMESCIALGEESDSNRAQHHHHDQRLRSFPRRDALANYIGCELNCPRWMGEWGVWRVACVACVA